MKAIILTAVLCVTTPAFAGHDDHAASYWEQRGQEYKNSLDNCDGYRGDAFTLCLNQAETNERLKDIEDQLGE